MPERMPIRDLKLLLSRGKLIEMLEDPMRKLAKILERDAPPNCYNLDTYAVQLRQYTYLCRKVRQSRRILEHMLSNPKKYR